MCRLAFKDWTVIGTGYSERKNDLPWPLGSPSESSFTRRQQTFQVERWRQLTRLQQKQRNSLTDSQYGEKYHPCESHRMPIPRGRIDSDLAQLNTLEKVDGRETNQEREKSDD